MPCANVCAKGPAATGHLLFIPYEINPSPFLLHPCGLGNNNIGATIFFVYRRKII